MIRLERPATPPAYFASPEIERFRAGVRAFFSRPERKRRQERPEFPLFPRRSYALVLEALGALSHQKCAYCESSMAASGAALDRFRPKAGAVGLKGDFSTEHYWWLAYAWENIYPCCLKCNKFKGGKFPVEGRRCRADAGQQELAAERRLLVDPFVDVPHEHLDFLDNGTVVPRSSMGDITIHTLELNRSDLVRARQRVAQDVSRQLARTRLPSNVVGEAVSWLERLEGSASRVEDAPNVLRRVARSLDGSQPYAAVARALLRRWLTQPAKNTRVRAPFWKASWLPAWTGRFANGRVPHGGISPPKALRRPGSTPSFLPTLKSMGQPSACAAWPQPTLPGCASSRPAGMLLSGCACAWKSRPTRAASGPWISSSRRAMTPACWSKPASFGMSAERPSRTSTGVLTIRKSVC